jgi:hypothetical protein
MARQFLPDDRELSDYEAVYLHDEGLYDWHGPAD